MKIAALSDIHSNVFALEAVIADAKKRGVEMMINLGDILYGPIAPRATFELLMANDFITIRGNQDRQLYQATRAEIESNPTLQFILEDLGEEPLAWMKTLPFDLQLSNDIYLCHGTPTDDLVYLLENVNSGYAQLRCDQQIIELLDGQCSSVILCGHTHIARTVHISSNQLIINPGSVGLPAYTDEQPVAHSMASFSPLASYAIVEQSENGWCVNHIKVPYDVENAVNHARQRARLDWVHFLATGRGLE